MLFRRSEILSDEREPGEKELGEQEPDEKNLSDGVHNPGNHGGDRVL